MKNLLIISVFVVAIAVILVHESEEAPDPVCKKIEGEFQKKQMKGVAACTKAIKKKTKKKPKMNCILRCVMIKEHLLNKDGQLTEEDYNSFLVNDFPPVMVNRLNNTFFGCMQIAMEGFKTMEEDDTCKSYDNFIKCLMVAVPDLCN